MIPNDSDLLEGLIRKIALHAHKLRNTYADDVLPEGNVEQEILASVPALVLTADEADYVLKILRQISFIDVHSKNSDEVTSFENTILNARKIVDSRINNHLKFLDLIDYHEIETNPEKFKQFTDGKLRAPHEIAERIQADYESKGFYGLANLLVEYYKDFLGLGQPEAIKKAAEKLNIDRSSVAKDVRRKTPTS